MSALNYLYDAAASFRAPASDALTETGTVGELALDKLAKVRPGFQKNKLGAEQYTIVLNVESLDFVTTEDAGAIPPTVAEVYTITIDTGAAGATDTTVLTFVPTTTGNFAFMLDSHSIEHLDANRDAIAVKLTAVGDAPSIKVSAWLL